MKTLLLKKEEVKSLLKIEAVIASVEESYKSYSTGKTIQPQIVSIELPEQNGEMDIKAGYSRNTGMISVKCASGFYDNQDKGTFPNSMSTVLLFNGDTGFPVCIMDGSLITGSRTGAAGAVSARLLARKDSKTAAVIGTGEQARMQVLALKSVMGIKTVRIWGRSQERMEAYQKEMAPLTECLIELCNTPEDAVKHADIVITTTPSKSPIIRREWIRPGTHIIAVGADTEGKQELEASIFQGARIVVDHINQCLTRGETQNPIRLGLIKESDIDCEIGQILLGLKKGRTNDQEITIFDMTGMAVQDNITAAKIYERALAFQIGAYYDFME